LISQLPIEQQIGLIKRGTLEIIPEDELRAKLKKPRSPACR